MSTQSKSANEPKIVKMEGEEAYIASDSLQKRALRHLRHDKLTLTAIGVVTILTLLSVFAPFITDNILHIDPNTTDPRNNFLPPLAQGHILGTDDIGRDHLARLLHAGRVSLGIGFVGSGVTLVIGLAVGTIMGFYGGVIDDFFYWVITTLDSIPSHYLLIIISAVFRPNAEALILVLALVGWTGTTRLIRGQTIAIRDLEYILAARALGAPAWRIIVSHILPNLVSVTAVSLAIGVGGLILAESALSFLGIGVQPPTATWGNMLSGSQQYFRLGGHLVVMPGLMIFLVVLSAYVIGDGVRDAFDPTTVD